MQILKNVFSCFLWGSTRVLTILSVHLQHIYLLLGSPVTGNCSSGRLYAVQFQEIPGIQHVDGCFPIQVTMVRVRVGRLFKVKMYVKYSMYVHFVYKVCTRGRVKKYICTYM